MLIYNSAHILSIESSHAFDNSGRCPVSDMLLSRLLSWKVWSSRGESENSLVTMLLLLLCVTIHTVHHSTYCSSLLSILSIYLSFSGPLRVSRTMPSILLPLIRPPRSPWPFPGKTFLQIVFILWTLSYYLYWRLFLLLLTWPDLGGRSVGTIGDYAFYNFQVYSLSFGG